MKTKFYLICLFILAGFSNNVYSQVSFSHSLGASYFAGGHAAAPAITYSPRLNVVEMSDDMTVSVGTHLSLGLTIGEQGNSFALDAPAVAEFNFGHAATRNSDAAFGGFVGAGYGISRIGSQGAFGADFNEAAGPVLNGGIRALINDIPLTLRVSYMINTLDDASDVFGVGLFFNFGDF
ncbi:hypothetical protein RCC89_20720 [Cytophagaceae bacterium ABcell3]|nr:hypothetical protein RCC89_20720 [Cytophagaceae bacterium ABcell3]